MDIQQLPVFFIVCHPRSGSTLLRTLFDAHPNVSIPSECPFIISLYPKYGRITHWDNATIQAFVDDLWQQYHFPHYCYNKVHLKTRLQQEVDRLDYALACKIVLANCASIYPKGDIRLLGNHLSFKAYLAFNLPLLKSLFPNCRFVHIFRDPRDTFLSCVNAGFYPANPGFFSGHWSNIHGQLKKSGEEYPDSYHPLRYEELASSPAASLSVLCQFLGIPFTSAQLDFHQALSPDEFQQLDFLSNQAKRTQVHLFQPITTRYINRWKTALTSRQVKIIDLMVCRILGQSPYTTTSQPSIASRLESIPYRLHAAFWRGVMRVVSYLRNEFLNNQLINQLNRMYRRAEIQQEKE